MKKFFSFLLVAVMLFSVMAPMASAGNYEYLPIIYIRGNGEALFYPDGTPLIAKFEDISLGGDESTVDKDAIVEAAVNILKPFVLEGMIFDNWDNYGRAIYEEIKPLLPDAGLDGNGNPTKGTGISEERKAFMQRLPYSKWEYNNGCDYSFVYDWRLSPYDYVDDLHTFITQVMKTTGKKQVNIWARCLGGGLLSAYLDKYGHLGHIKNAMFCEVLSNEATVISKSFSGKIEFDAKLIERYAGQLDFCGRMDEGTGFAFTDMLYEIVFKTMDFFNQINVTDTALDGVEELYSKLYKALVPALCHAVGMATQANYWTAVAEEDMDDALNLIFGEEGSELRTKYKGLIDKILLYRNNLTKDMDGFYNKLIANGIHIGFTSKYGFMNTPITADADLLSDALVSLVHGTYGATAAKIGGTLSDEYIEAKTAEGKGKYISPDRQVDLSSCLTPDTVWVYKNVHHDTFEPCEPVLRAFLNGTKETVESVGLPRFNVYSYETGTTAPMTEDNSADYEWITRPVENPTTETRMGAFMRFFTLILNFITKFFKGELDFSNLFSSDVTVQ